ncbi:hypothetical protein KR018_000879 [Drosophila ironensis]|nr:hypothetical protein KR018_000879 [Drosophila ironensis]
MSFNSPQIPGSIQSADFYIQFDYSYGETGYPSTYQLPTFRMTLPTREQSIYIFGVVPANFASTLSEVLRVYQANAYRNFYAPYTDDNAAALAQLAQPQPQFGFNDTVARQVAPPNQFYGTGPVVYGLYQPNQVNQAGQENPVGNQVNQANQEDISVAPAPYVDSASRSLQANEYPENTGPKEPSTSNHGISPQRPMPRQKLRRVQVVVNGKIFTQKRMQCRICWDISSNMDMFLAHTSSCLSVPKPFSCTLCPYLAETNAKLEAHRRNCPGAEEVYTGPNSEV